MMLFRGGALRRLCSLPVRPYGVAVDVSDVGVVASASVSVAVDGETGDASDVAKLTSVREASKSRTRARVEDQLRFFLRSPNELWTQGPPVQAYWLLRACGSDMIMETTATRMDLTQEMWKEFQKRAPLPVGMYNTLLQVYLQNGHKFDPAEFLETMEEAGVLPNQGTLVGILCCYCEEGDIEGATRILDQMRSLDMEISENIYAALITGHCRRGDMESAEGMLMMMEENGMPPTATSYTALLCGYAERGNMDRVEKLLEDMRERRVFPSVSVYANILDRLSASGHSDLLSRALDLFHNKQLLYNELYQLACKCTMRRDNKGTLIMLRCMATLSTTHNIQLGAILVRTMASQGRSLPEIMVMVAELQSLGFGHHVHEEVLHHLHTREEGREEAINDALTVLQDMHRHGVIVKEHYFYPILAYYANQADMEGAVRCVVVMKDVGLKLKRMTFQYMLQATKQGGVASSEEGVASSNGEGVASNEESVAVNEEGMANSDGFSRLLDHVEGTPLLLSLANELSVYLLDRGQFGRVPGLLSSADPRSLQLGRILKAIKTGVNESKSTDVEGLVKVYTALHSLPDPPDLPRSISLTTSSLVQKSPDVGKEFIDKLSGSGIDPGEMAYHSLLHSYATPDTIKEFHSMVKSLQSRGLVLRPSLHKRILELAAEMGDPVRAGQAVSAIKRSGQHLSATAYSRYIIANAKARRIGTSLELYERMRSYDLQPSYDAMHQLIVELLHWGDMHGAENMRKDLEEMGYVQGMGLRNAFIGAYSRRDMTRALQEFEALKASKYTPSTHTYNEIMVGYSLHGDTESIRKLFDELQREGLSLDRRLVSRLFDAYVTKGDMEGAVAMVSEHPSLPPHTSSLVQAMQLSVDRQNEEEIASVREHLRKVCGDRITDNAVFFAYIKADQMEKAAQILQSSEFSLNPRDMISFILDMKKKRRREQAYAALEMLKGKGHHLGDENSDSWLKAYDILGDVGSALALKTELEAAGHVFSEEFSSALASMIEKHGYDKSGSV